MKKTLLTAVFISLLALPLLAEPVKFSTSFNDVDWTTGGVAGVGSVGSGLIQISGVGGGTVIAAVLYWHGIDQTGSGGDGVYDNETIFLDGVAVTGTAVGDSGTNCWGPGSARSFRAVVTSLVSGDGLYELTGLASKPGHSANGASLIVIYDDGNSANDVDLAFFEGNDTNVAGFPGDPAGWAATLPGIVYAGGPVFAELHLADGQNAPDGTLNLSTANGNFVRNDDNTLYDGISVPGEGNGRGNHGLWDVHRLDTSSAFGGVADTVTLTLTGLSPSSDCLALVLLALEFEGDTVIPEPTVCQVDGDEDVDRDDIELIFAARNQPALGVGDPRDANDDGVINVLDSRLCARQCTVPGCSPPVQLLALPAASATILGKGKDGTVE